MKKVTLYFKLLLGAVKCLIILLVGILLLVIALLINQLHIPIITIIPVLTIALGKLGLHLPITITIYIVGLLVFLTMLIFIKTIANLFDTAASPIYKSIKKIFKLYFCQYNCIISDIKLYKQINHCNNLFYNIINTIILAPIYLIKGICYLLIQILKYLYIILIANIFGIFMYVVYSYFQGFSTSLFIKMSYILSYFMSINSWAIVVCTLIIAIGLSIIKIRFGFNMKDAMKRISLLNS